MAKNQRGHYGSANPSEDISPTYREARAGAVLYMGVAPAGSSESDAVWRVVKIGADKSITYADGNDYYDNVWNDYLSLSYS